MPKVKTRSFKIERPQKESQAFKLIDPNEAIILSHLPTKWKWVARDKDGNLYLFIKKPSKGSLYWMIGSRNRTDVMEFPYRNLFKCIKWTDSDPTNIDRLLQMNLPY